MAGGTFTPGTSKVRPGAYINLTGKPKPITDLPERGTVVIPLSNHKYGPTNEFISIDVGSQDGMLSKVGFRIDTPEMLLVREAFKNAKTVLAYVTNKNTAKATATISTLTVTAKYPGSRGNDFNVVISDDVANKEVKIFLGEDLIFQQNEVSDVTTLKENDFVTFSGSGACSDTAGTKLTGGADVAEVNGDVTALLDNVETQVFNTLAFPWSDASLKASAVSKIKYFRDGTGKMVNVVLQDLTADYEGIISVNNGVILDDGTQIDVSKATAWVAGAEASAMANESLTYSNYQGAVDILPRRTGAEIIDALKKGQIIFTLGNGNVRVEQDINTLTTFTVERPKMFSKNRVVRGLDSFIQTVNETLVPKRYEDTPDGIDFATKGIYEILLQFEAQRIFKNVAEDDIVVDASKTVGDEFYATVGVQPVDSKEKYYITVVVS